MSLTGIQQDYGGFDPKYVGVSLKFYNQRTWDFFRSPAAQNPSVVFALPPDKAFEALSAITVLEHEVRHFHDFLLTPYSSYLFRIRASILINGLQFLKFLYIPESRKDSNCLPMPVTLWCRKNEQERKQLVASWNDLNQDQPLVPFELPFLNDDLEQEGAGSKITSYSEASLKDLIVTNARNYHKIKQLVVNPQSNSSFQPSHIFEISSILIQLQQVWLVFGAEAAQFFLDHIIQLDAPYTRIFRVLSSSWTDRGLPIDTNIISAMAFWSLMGNYRIDAWRADPTYRIAALHKLFLTNGPPTEPKPLMNLFDEWSDALKLSAVKQSLEHTIEANERHIEKLESVKEEVRKRSEDNLFVSDADETLILALQSVAQATRYMANLFLDSPERYVYPDLYLEAYTEMVNPPVRADFIDGAMLGSEQDFTNDGFKIYVAREHESGLLALQSALMPVKLSEVNFIDPALAYKLYNQMLIVDFCFSEFNRDELDFRLVRQEFFNESGLQPRIVLY